MVEIYKVDPWLNYIRLTYIRLTHEKFRVSVQLSCYVTEIEKRKQARHCHDGLVDWFDRISVIG
jgi:hypothetical protein